jgi:hypothetical protein
MKLRGPGFAPHPVQPLKKSGNPALEPKIFKKLLGVGSNLADAIYRLFSQVFVGQEKWCQIELKTNKNLEKEADNVSLLFDRHAYKKNSKMAAHTRNHLSTFNV